MPRSLVTRSAGRVFVAAGGGVLLLVAGAQVVFGGSAAGPAMQGADRPPRISMIDYRVQDAGNYQLLVTNWGQLGSQPQTSNPWSGEPSLQWPKGTSSEYLWSCGFWVGAEVAGTAQVSTAAYSAEFLPELDPVARVYWAAEGAPGGRRSPDPAADDDADGTPDEDRLNGLDDDGDGMVDEDFAAISDQMLFAEFRDNRVVDPPRPNHTPLGIRVEQAVLAWADSTVDDIVGLDYSITNINEPGGAVLSGLHTGLFADCDIGTPGVETLAEDDRAGFWEGLVTTQASGGPRNVKVSIGYMFDGDGDGGATPGWIGLVVLGGEASPSNLPPVEPVDLVNFRYFSGAASYAAGGDPTDDTERYEVLCAADPFPLPPPDPGSGFRPSQLGPRFDDYRMVTSAGPLGLLAPGETAHVQFAIVLGGGFEALLQNAARARILYENGWRVLPPVAVAVHDLEASVTSAGVELGWRLGREAVSTMQAVRVQRGAAAAGPFAELAGSPLAPASTMRCLDREVVSGNVYWYRLLLQAAGGEVTTYGPVRVEVPAATGFGTALAVPVQVEGGLVRLAYTLGTASPVQLGVFDVRGQQVVRLDLGLRGPGAYQRDWDRRDSRGRRVGRGVYFVRLDAAGVRVARKLVLTQP